MYLNLLCIVEYLLVTLQFFLRRGEFFFEESFFLVWCKTMDKHQCWYKGCRNVHSTDPSLTCSLYMPNHIIVIIHPNMPPKAFSQSFAALKIFLRFPTAASNEHKRWEGKKDLPIGIGIIVSPLYWLSKEKRKDLIRMRQPSHNIPATPHKRHDE